MCPCLIAALSVMVCWLFNCYCYQNFTVHPALSNIHPSIQNSPNVSVPICCAQLTEWGGFYARCRLEPPSSALESDIIVSPLGFKKLEEKKDEKKIKKKKKKYIWLSLKIANWKLSFFSDKAGHMLCAYVQTSASIYIYIYIAAALANNM